VTTPVTTLRSLGTSLLLGAIVTALVAVISYGGLLRGVELQGYDLLVFARGFAPPADEAVIVDFDDATDAVHRTFPLPRALLAEVVEKVAAGEPALIGLDVLLDQERLPADDAKLAASLTLAGNVILAENFAVEGLPASQPIPLFRQQAFDVAFVNVPMDEDGSVRRMLLWRRIGNYQGVSFPVALASNYLGKPLEPGRLGEYRLGSVEIPHDDTGPDSALIGHWSPRPARHVSVLRLLAQDFEPHIFQGRIVLIGQSSAKGKDFYPTPVFRFYQPAEGRRLLSGTEIHAAALATLLTGKTVSVLGNLPLWILNFLLTWMLIALLLAVRPAMSVPAALALFLGSYLLAQGLFSYYHVWMKFISTEAGLFLAVPAGLGYRYLEERRLKAATEAERRELMSLFERYVSPEVAAEIWKRRSEIVLAGEERTATVLFSDIRSFTAQTAGKPSAEVLTWLNDYFNAMSDVIKQNGGYLNKFIGDGLLVVFGVPISSAVETDACRAVEAALGMLERVEEMNRQQAPGRPRLAIGIGLHTGPLTAGNVGARDRLEYSVIGETVNLASRLEALTKDFKIGIVLSPQTAELVRDHFETVPLGEVTVRGFTEKITVYTVGKRNTSRRGE